MPAKSQLMKALERGLSPDGSLAEELRALGDYSLSTAADAQAVCAALEQVAQGRRKNFGLSLYWLASLFQQVGSQDAYEILSKKGLPILISMYDMYSESEHPDEDRLLFLLKIFTLYVDDAATKRLLAAARANFAPEGYLWSVIFGQIEEDHPHRVQICDALRRKLPSGFLAIAYLDFVNTLCRNGEVQEHPFDSRKGKKMLERYLLSSNADEYSYAHTATASLPFMSNPERDQLLALAMDHADRGVQMEAGWASAKLGSQGGIKFLARLCKEPDSSKAACAYLEELGLEHAIPVEARDPEFQAIAELNQWLQHPNEFGRVPDRLEVIDTRELFWPPTNDHRRLWLIKYRFENEESAPDEGVGLVGSVTFSLFNEATASMPAEDIYALHCCWELEINKDPRAPKKRSVQAGRRLLREAQE